MVRKLMQQKLALEGITFEGNPIAPLIEEVEHREYSADFNSEVRSIAATIARGSGKGRVKMGGKEATGPVSAAQIFERDSQIEETQSALEAISKVAKASRQGTQSLAPVDPAASRKRKLSNSDIDTFGRLLEHKGLLPLTHWIARTRKERKLKLTRIFLAVKAFPDQCELSDVRDYLEEKLGKRDPQQFILQLHQGGYLTKGVSDKAVILHVKTELAKTLTDSELAADIWSKRDSMPGYEESSSKTLKLTRGKPSSPPAPLPPRQFAQEPTKPKKSSPIESKIITEIAEIPKETELGARPDAPIKEEAPEETLQSFVVAATAARDLPSAPDLNGLTQADIRMILDQIQALATIRRVLPELTHADFLQTFTKGSRHVSR